MNVSPIALFCYNRPWHVEQTLNALFNNLYANNSTLYIFCDGAKANASVEQIQKIRATRVVAHKKKWCGEVHVIESDKNKGLANSIISGVTEVVNKYGKVIVLEDDLVTSPFFLKYMNEALEFYKDRPSVMSVSANRPPIDKMAIPTKYPFDAFVSLRPFSTGWATWKEKWNLTDWTLDYLPEMLSDPVWVESFNRGGDDLTDMLCMQHEGKIDSWAIRWAYSHFKEHGVGILPCVPYVDNIGFDGTGVHSGSDERDFRNDVMKAPENPRFPDVLYEDRRIVNAMANYYSHKKMPLWNKFYNIIAELLGKEKKIRAKIYAE